MRIPYRFLQSLPAIALALLLADVSPAQEPSTASETASATSSAQSSEKLIYNSTAERDNDLLAKAYAAIAKPEEIVWLETPDERIVSLFRPHETRKAKGALLLLHAPETPQLWPASLENPRRNLPLYGWATMAVALPAKSPVAVPLREAASSSNSAEDATSETASASVSYASVEAAAISSSASSSSAPAIPRSQLITNRVDAAVAQLNKDGQFNLVVLVDNSSAPDALAGLLQKINKGGGTPDTIDGPLQALILVNMQKQEPLTKAQLNAIFSVATLPVLDVFFGPENPTMLEARRLHKAEAMRQNLTQYQQLLISPEQQETIDEKRGFWLAKVQGFLEQAARGSEQKGGAPTGDIK
jgi:hypothetical protein